MNSKRRRVSMSRLGIGLAALSLFSGGGPLLAATPDTEIAGAHPLFVLGADGAVSVLNTETYQIVGTFSMGPSGPGAMAITPDGCEIATIGPDQDSVAVLDTQRFEKTTIPVGSSPTALGIRPDSRRIYVANNYDSTVSVIDTATRKVVDSIKVSTNPQVMVANPVRPRLYVGSGSGSISVIDTATDQVVATVPLGLVPRYLAVTPDGRQLFAGDAHGAIAVVAIDPDPAPAGAQPSAILEIGSGVRDMAVSEDGARLYVLSEGDDSSSPLGAVWVFSTTNYLRMAAVKVGSEPAHLLENPTRHQLYVTNPNSNSVSVIDTTTYRVSRTVPVGWAPVTEALSPDGRQLYVANLYDRTISVLDVDAGFTPVVAPIRIEGVPTVLIVKP